jgi:hypothetical protein
LILAAMLIAIVLVPFPRSKSSSMGSRPKSRAGEGSRWLAAGGRGLLGRRVLPVPSSIVSTAAGVLLGFWRGTAVVFAGMTAGCLLGYAVGSRSSAVARRVVGEDGLVRAADLVRRYGDWVLVACRPVPVLAEASVIFAGLAHAPFGRFVSPRRSPTPAPPPATARWARSRCAPNRSSGVRRRPLLVPGWQMGIARVVSGR